MKMRKIAGIASTSLSVVITLYFWVAIAIELLAIATLEFDRGLFWQIVISAVAATNLALLVISRSVTAYVASFFTHIPLVFFLSFYISVLIIGIYLIVYLVYRKIAIKIIGAALCILLTLVTILLIAVGSGFKSGLRQFDMENWDHYASPDNATEIIVYSSRSADESYSDYNNYYVSVRPHDLVGVDLGPIIYKTRYVPILHDGPFEELPEAEVEWINNDVFRIYGKVYRVSDYVVNKEVADHP